MNLLSPRLAILRRLPPQSPSVPPAEALPLLSRASDLLCANKPDDALPIYQQVLERFPSLAAAYCGRGACYERGGDPERAMADYDRACGTDPLDARAFLYRGLLHRTQKQLQRALDDLQRAESLASHDPEPCCALALVYMDLGEDFDALEAYSRAFERDHRCVKALSERARIYMNHECFVAALADYATCTQLQPEDPQHWVNLGNAFYELGDFGRATPNYQHALSLRANLPEVYLNLGCVALDQDNLHAALRHFDRAIHLDATYARAYLNRGLTHLYLGRTQKADADVTKAIELDDQDPDSRFAFARVCAHVNRLRPAIDALAFALDRCPDYVDELVEDPIFADLRKLNDVKKLIARAEQALADLS